MADHTNRKMVWLCVGLTLIALGPTLWLAGLVFLGWLITFSGLLLVLRFCIPSMFLNETSKRVSRQRFVEDHIRGSARNTPPGYWVEDAETVVTAKESFGCWFVFSAIAVMGTCGAWKLQTDYMSWHLTGTQRVALATMGSELPSTLSVLVELPEAYNAEGQRFGKQVQDVFVGASKAKVNRGPMIHGFGSQITGVVVQVPPEPETVRCSSRDYGIMLSIAMSQSGIESSYSPGEYLDCASIRLLIGKRPKD